MLLGLAAVNAAVLLFLWSLLAILKDAEERMQRILDELNQENDDA